MIALIDADFYTYSIPFICQDGYKKEAVLNSEARFLTSLLDSAIRKVCNETNATEYKLFLTGKGNFREKFPTYKAQRADSTRPLLYQDARDYLTKAHNAIICEGIEADDEVIIQYNEITDTGKKAVMCHLDKDLNQAPGLHYKPAVGKRPSKKYRIVETIGTIFLFYQSLTGDKVDNIPGVHGIGEKKAKKILEGLEKPIDLYDKVLETYLDNGLSEENMNEQLEQLYLLRFRDDSWEDFKKRSSITNDTER